jgi:hypothetical protein
MLSLISSAFPTYTCHEEMILMLYYSQDDEVLNALLELLIDIFLELEETNDEN